MHASVSSIVYLMQFNRFESRDGRISERDFAESLVVYAGYNSKRRVRMLKRVKKAFKDTQVVSYNTWMCEDDFVCFELVVVSRSG